MGRNQGHAFGEAFMLMKYACKACGHQETIWNSRDGVTPFGCSCPSCGDIMSHIDWEKDVYAPNHKLHHGQRFWRDGTPDEAEAIMRRRCDQMRDSYPITRKKEEVLIAACRNGTASEFQHGWPMLDQGLTRPI